MSTHQINNSMQYVIVCMYLQCSFNNTLKYYSYVELLNSPPCMGGTYYVYPWWFLPHLFPDMLMLETTAQALIRKDSSLNPEDFTDNSEVCIQLYHINSSMATITNSSLFILRLFTLLLLLNVSQYWSY